MNTESQSSALTGEIAKRPCLRILLGLMAVLIWCVIGALGLELVAASSIWWAERHNAFILATKQHRSLSDTPAARPLQKEEALCKACDNQPDWDSLPKGTALPSWAVPSKALSKNDIVERSAAFAALNESERSRYALLNDELILVLDADATIRCLYGNWEVRAPFNAGAELPLLSAFKKRIREAGAWPPPTPVSTLDLAFSPEPGMEDNKEIVIRGGGAGGANYAFMPSDFRTLVMKSLPQDTPWDRIAFFRYKQNLRNCRSGLGLTFDTNNYGFRDRDVVVPKPPDVIRIACVGGSTTEEGPTNDTTYPKLVEKMLSVSLRAGKRVEVLNCGISGMTTTAHVARLADYLELEPDMLLFYEGVNDIHRDLVEYWRAIRSPVLRRVLSHSRFTRWQFNSALYPGNERMRADIRDSFVANLHAIADVAQARGIRMAICSVASPRAASVSTDERCFYDYCARTSGLDPCLNLSIYEHILSILNEEVRALCSRDTLLYIPVAEHIHGGCDTFTDLYHMTNSGIERKAEAISDCLARYLPSAS